MNDPSTIHWLAFRYIAGELPTAECEAFEQRLAVDQSAREAVAEMVAVAQAVCDGSAAVVQPAREPVKRTQTRRTSRHAVLAVSAVALLAALSLVLNDSTQNLDEAETHAAEFADEADRLWALWSRGELAGADPDTEVEPLSTDFAGLPWDVADDADIDIPGWMLAAVAVESGDSTSGRLETN